MRILKPESCLPWTLCPYPQRWRAYDGMTSEVELYQFLTSLVILHKPEVIVETGTYMGDGSIALAEGCIANGFGHVWTYDIKSIQPSMIDVTSGWITPIIDDATHAKWDGPPIELLFCDGGYDRHLEILNFLPYLAPRHLIVAHDATNHEYGWSKLGDQFLPVMIPCARGLWIMRKFTNTPIKVE